MKINAADNIFLKQSLVRHTIRQAGEILTEISPLQQFAFATTCCQRCLPNYTPFQKQSGLGDILPLADSLEAMWDFLCGKNLSGSNIEKMITAIAIPEDEDNDIFIIPHSDLSFEMTDLAQSTGILFLQTLSLLQDVIKGKTLLISEVLDIRDFVLDDVMASQIATESNILQQAKQSVITRQWALRDISEDHQIYEEAIVIARVDQRYIRETSKQLETLLLIQQIDFTNPDDIKSLRLASTFDGASNHGYRL